MFRQEWDDRAELLVRCLKAEAALRIAEEERDIWRFRAQRYSKRARTPRVTEQERTCKTCGKTKPIDKFEKVKDEWYRRRKRQERTGYANST